MLLKPRSVRCPSSSPSSFSLSTSFSSSWEREHVKIFRSTCGAASLIRLMHLVALYVIGNDEYSRMLRRSLMCYLNLSLILVLRSISSAVKRRFPTLDHVVDSGFMTTLELELYQSVPSVEFNTYWISCTWFVNLLKEARNNHRLPDAQGLKFIIDVRICILPSCLPPSAKKDKNYKKEELMLILCKTRNLR